MQELREEVMSERVRELRNTFPNSWNSVAADRIRETQYCVESPREELRPVGKGKKLRKY